MLQAFANEIFELIVSDAWKNSMFTKDIYIAAMRDEIRKSHDRLRKRIKTGLLH